VNISEKARDFIEKCLTIDPKKRISWKAVYSHPLIVEELQIKYGLTSSIKLQENQVFYDRDSQPEEQVSLEKEIEKEVEIPEEVVREPQVNVG
jgi:serine/threonine protein kinase